MQSVKQASQKLSQKIQARLQQFTQEGNIWKKLRGAVFFAIGYLLSPLCWWNDIVFNLPIAYFFGYICSLFNRDLLLPSSIVGYWLSNIIGILMMQAGAMDVLQGQPKERNLKKELSMGIASSTAYTLVILALIQLKILDAPVFSVLFSSRQ
ncbi:MAG: hypothetical protein CLLPBCKN_005989 [Chroococcidiopsis cubana SAG 39.79]|uniref:DUF2628 domain-containing protein n=2 Tax=Chroococcidiopsis TaxID=54298 RepID=A0AB37UGV3_9CYAN|nr:hypothetical protein [Chroococcidiopsis cubana]MDZ4876554.1 hypothetical protein [Chroococcidiopsis cubana SAG 39.79]RUT10383.1 hypothetical protein DSM107010_43790 [Chroococcidiopsis cubana SAG 39.79]